jgi:hypothetical protein
VVFAYECSLVEPGQAAAADDQPRR